MSATERRRGGAPFDEGHERFRAQVRRFVDRELAPHADRWERDGRFPRRALAACGRRGYLALDPSGTAVLTEELARCESMGVALSILVQAGLVGPLVDILRQRMAPPPTQAARVS